MPNARATALSPTEGTTFIPFRARKAQPDPDAHPITNDHPLERVKDMFKWSTSQKSISKGILAKMSPTIDQLVEFTGQELPEQDGSFGITEVPTALLVGRDRALLSAVLAEAISTTVSTVVKLDEGDCNNSTSALRALVSGFMSQFEESDSESVIKRKTSTTLAPFDMARLVTGYEDYYKLRDRQTNLVVVIEQLESFDADVIQDIIYACSKNSDSLPMLFILTASDDTYLQEAFTTATRAMLDISVFRSPPGLSLCLSAISEGWGDTTECREQIILGESSIRVLKDIIEKTDGRIDGLLTALHLIHMEHVRYQAPIVEAARKYTYHLLPQISNNTEVKLDLVAWNDKVSINPEDSLSAFITLSKRKLPLADGFSPSDVEVVKGQEIFSQAYSLGQREFVRYADKATYGLTFVFKLIQELYDIGGQELEKYIKWMLEKGFKSASTADLRTVANAVHDAIAKPRYEGEDPPLYDSLWGIGGHYDGFEPENRVRLASGLVETILWWFEPKHPFYELYITESTDGLKELIDPAPRSVVLSSLIRPSAYLHCDCCDPEDAQTPETMSQSPDTCALFQRSLEAGRLLNVADWFNAFIGIMQNESVKCSTREPEGTRVRRSVSRSRRATSSVHMESDADADGEVDEALEVQREHQARFLLSTHELEFLGLIQSTGRRKEHVLRTVFEAGD
ncbi:origin recognition complex subunit 3 [Ceratobasidium sp. AG-Ba]|nr:origin recognition complex subunit 3 [Ceratobasidium sp. AG-Ba]